MLRDGTKKRSEKRRFTFDFFCFSRFALFPFRKCDILNGSQYLFHATISSSFESSFKNVSPRIFNRAICNTKHDTQALCAGRSVSNDIGTFGMAIIVHT